MILDNSVIYGFIAVDFDGTLCKDCFPEIGEPIGAVINFIKEQAEEGAKIILYTCRENHPDGRQFLDEAVEWCAAQGIPIAATNENPWSPYDTPELKSRKIYADLYIDDKAVNAAEFATAAYALHFAISSQYHPRTKKFTEAYNRAAKAQGLALL